MDTTTTGEQHYNVNQESTSYERLRIFWCHHTEFEIVAWLLYDLFNNHCRYFRFSGSRNLVLSSQVCSINSHVSKRWVVQYNWTSEEHPADPFHILNNLKNQSASVSLCISARACSGQSGAVIAWHVVVSSSLISGCRLFNTILPVMLSIAVLTNEVWMAWSESFLVLATVTHFGYV